MKQKKATDRPSDMTQLIELALRRARRQARKTARMYGTPFYTMKNGKIIAEKP